MARLRLPPSGPFVDIDGGSELALAVLPDATADIPGVAGQNVRYINPALTAGRVYTLTQGTAEDGDRLTFVLRNLNQAILFQGIAGSGGVAFNPAPLGQTLVVEWLGSAWIIIEQSNDTISDAEAPNFQAFPPATIESTFPQSLGFVGVEVEGDNAWVADVAVHVDPASDTVLTFALRLDDPTTGDIIAQWDEYFSPESGAYSRAMKPYSNDSAGVADGIHPLYLVVLANSGGVVVDLDFPSGMNVYRRPPSA